jgi:hypothetical protein
VDGFETLLCFCFRDLTPVDKGENCSRRFLVFGNSGLHFSTLEEQLVAQYRFGKAHKSAF